MAGTVSADITTAAVSLSTLHGKAARSFLAD
jgi:hypothetical protein